VHHTKLEAASQEPTHQLCSRVQRQIVVTCRAAVELRHVFLPQVCNSASPLLDLCSNCVHFHGFSSWQWRESAYSYIMCLTSRESLPNSPIDKDQYDKLQTLQTLSEDVETNKSSRDIVDLPRLSSESTMALGTNREIALGSSGGGGGAAIAGGLSTSSALLPAR
jgi:hypothetical protein